MKRRIVGTSIIALHLLVICLLKVNKVSAQAPLAALAAFNNYTGAVEARLAQQRRSRVDLVASSRSEETEARLRRGDTIIEKLSPGEDDQPEGALLHDWKGTIFVRGATVADFESLMKNLSSYPQRFAPQVTRAMILSPHATKAPDHFTALMRVRQKHVITVVMDTTYDVLYGRVDAHRGFSISRSTKIAEIADAGTRKERALGPTEDHGFLWRLNTYWSYEERDGGLYMQIESVSLTRGVPPGLGWAIEPFLESVPRESLEFTLRAVSKTLQKQTNSPIERN